jgi:hypothetical protein
MGILSLFTVRKVRFMADCCIETVILTASVCLFPTEENYVTKFMSTFGCLFPVEGHQAWRRLKNGTIARWPYIEPNSRHNKSKHWVDDVNNRRHAPIDFSTAWKTKWWPMRQFAFFLSVAEVNAVNSCGRARGLPADPTLDFRRELALQLMENHVGVDMIPRSPTRARATRARVSMHAEDGAHELMSRPYYTSKWLGSEWKQARQRFQKTPCATVGCNKTCRTYCSCNKAVTMCLACFNLHNNNV